MTDDPFLRLQARQRKILLLVYVTEIGGVRQPITARTALKRHPEEFRALFEEMQGLVGKKRVVQLDLF